MLPDTFGIFGLLLIGIKIDRNFYIITLPAVVIMISGLIFVVVLIYHNGFCLSHSFVVFTSFIRETIFLHLMYRLLGHLVGYLVLRLNFTDL